MVKLLVDSGALIDNKEKVSTEPCMVLHRDSSLTISIYPTPPSRSSPPLSSLLSPLWILLYLFPLLRVEQCACVVYKYYGRGIWPAVSIKKQVQLSIVDR